MADVEIRDYLEGFRDGEDKKAVVQKSLPLRSLVKSDFSLGELKILDIYLARINSHDPSKRTVKFTKGEIENILGVDRIRKEELVKRLDKLYTPIEVELDVPQGYREAFRRMILFECVDFYLNEDGAWEIALTCTQGAMTAIFNIDNIGYLKYKLANVVNLKSRYSYALYILLENSIRSEFKISLEKLKQEMYCTSKSYDNINFFHEKVLKPALKEVNEKTTLTCDYAMIKKGRKITDVLFTITRGQMAQVQNTEQPVVEQNPLPSYLDFSNIPDEFLTPQQLEVKYRDRPNVTNDVENVSDERTDSLENDDYSSRRPNRKWI